MTDRTILKGDAKGGLLDKLINAGELPEVKVTVTKESLIGLAIMLIIVLTIFLLLSTILKALMK